MSRLPQPNSQSCPFSSSLEQHATVDVNGHHISVAGDVSALLPAGFTSRLTTSCDPVHGYHLSRQLDSLLKPADRMRSPNAGLLPVLRYIAKSTACELNETRDIGTHILSLPCAASDRRIVDIQVPQFLRSQERGLIRLGPRVDLATMIAQVVAAYPTCRIAVLGAHRDQLRAIRAKLGGWLPSLQCQDAVPPDDQEAWVAFSTFLAAADGDLEKCHLVLLPNASQATHQRAQAAPLRHGCQVPPLWLLA